jgi:hypothetical protein
VTLVNLVHDARPVSDADQVAGHHDPGQTWAITVGRPPDVGHSFGDRDTSQSDARIESPVTDAGDGQAIDRWGNDYIVAACVAGDGDRTFVSYICEILSFKGTAQSHQTEYNPACEK